MGALPEIVQTLHEPLSTASRHLANAAAPLAQGSIPVLGVPPAALPPPALPPPSAQAAAAIPVLGRNSAPVAEAAAPVAHAVPVLARAAPI